MYLSYPCGLCALLILWAVQKYILDKIFSKLLTFSGSERSSHNIQIQFLAYAVQSVKAHWTPSPNYCETYTYHAVFRSTWPRLPSRMPIFAMICSKHLTLHVNRHKPAWIRSEICRAYSLHSAVLSVHLSCGHNYDITCNSIVTMQARRTQVDDGPQGFKLWLQEIRDATLVDDDMHGVVSTKIMP